MLLKEKEKLALTDLQTQEDTCIKKYQKYSQDANDQELKCLFDKIKQQEEKHYQTIGEILSGTVASCDCNDTAGKDYQPKATYTQSDNSQAKKDDCFLATDCIASEKLVSSEYNTNVFTFGDSAIRKALADIQIEEQNHAEMLYKYKNTNGMA